MLAQVQMAGVLDWIVPAIFVFIVVASHIWKIIQGLAEQSQRNPRPNQRQNPQAQGDRPPQPPVEQSQLNSEIEEFLRRANERRAEKAKRSGKPDSAQKSAQQSPQPQSTARPKQKPKPRRDLETVSESVREHLGSRRLEQHASSLGKEVTQADAQFEQHLQQTFDHRVGTLAGATSDVAPAAADATAAPTDDRAVTARVVAGLALTPSSIRQAVLLKEILERPVDRW